MKRFSLTFVIFFAGLTVASAADYRAAYSGPYLRSAPAAHADAQGRLRPGEPVAVSRKRDGWVRVSTRNGRQGWVRLRQLREDTRGR